MLCQTAVAVDCNNFLFGTKLLIALSAKMTFQTSFLLIADTDPVAILEATGACPSFFHCTDDFMTGNHGEFCIAPIVVYDLNVSSCNATMGDFHQDVISADLSFIAKRLRLSTRPFNSEGFYFHGDLYI